MAKQKVRSIPKRAATRHLDADDGNDSGSEFDCMSDDLTEEEDDTLQGFASSGGRNGMVTSNAQSALGVDARHDACSGARNAAETTTDAYAPPAVCAHHHSFTTGTLRYAKMLPVRTKRNVYSLLRDVAGESPATADTFLPQHGISAGEFSVGQYVFPSAKTANGADMEDTHTAALRYFAAIM
jgi:hypothetical protein